jgi:hypothetical protein
VPTTETEKAPKRPQPKVEDRNEKPKKREKPKETPKRPPKRPKRETSAKEKTHLVA